MAQGRPGKTDSDSLAYHMRELHLKLHRTNAESMVTSKSPTIASSQNKLDRNDSSPRGNLGRNTSASRNVYTWNKSQLEQTQCLQKTVSPITVDTKWGTDFVTKNSFSDISQVSVAKSPTQGETTHSKNLDNLRNHQITKTDQSSLNNSPDSGLSVGSDGASSCPPSVNMAYQVRPMSFPHPNLQRAFKPIGAVVSNNPLPMNFVHISQNPPLTNLNANRWMQQPWLEKPYSHNAQNRCFREMSPNSIAQPLSVKLMTPASPLLKVSPNLSKNDPKTRGLVLKSELSPGVLHNAASTSPESSASRSSTIPSNSSAKNASSPTGISFIASSITHLTEVTNPQEKGESTICNCNRAPKMILCKTCGEMCHGRIRQRCKAHPNQIFLMDIRCCPHCQSENLKEIDCSKTA